jgi:hypothetical protein
MGAPTASPGGMGMAGMDIANPAISGIISNIMYYGAAILPTMKLHKTQDLEPTIKKPGVKRTKFYYGPLELASIAVSVFLLDISLDHKPLDVLLTP